MRIAFSPGRHCRGAFTLIELLMAMGITSLVTMVLAGLTMAVRGAREHVEGLEEATAQAQTALERIRYMTAQAGSYRIGGGATVPGVAVVAHQRSGIDVPDTLVVWCGGRGGGLSDGGLQTRLPQVNELLIYTPDPVNPARLVELAFPGDATTIDFASAAFGDGIRALVKSASAQSLPLCDRLRVSRLSGSTTGSAANLRFEIVQTPTSGELAGVTPGSAAWFALPWVQGVVSGDAGLRQAGVRIEAQVEVRDAGVEPRPTALPFFGSASFRYVYQQ